MPQDQDISGVDGKENVRLVCKLVMFKSYRIVFHSTDLLYRFQVKIKHHPELLK